MNLRQLVTEIRSVREDLKAVRKALEEKHCPPECSCRPKPFVFSYPATTSSSAYTTVPGAQFGISGGNWMGT